VKPDRNLWNQRVVGWPGSAARDGFGVAKPGQTDVPVGRQSERDVDAELAAVDGRMIPIWPMNEAVPVTPGPIVEAQSRPSSTAGSE